MMNRRAHLILSHGSGNGAGSVTGLACGDQRPNRELPGGRLLISLERGAFSNFQRLRCFRRKYGPITEGYSTSTNINIYGYKKTVIYTVLVILCKTIYLMILEALQVVLLHCRLMIIATVAGVCVSVCVGVPFTT